MNGLKLDLPTLTNLLRRSESDKAISDFFGEQITLMKREEYYGWLELKSQGVDVVFNEAPWVLPPEQVSDPKELYLIAFHFHRQGHEGYAEYNGVLPNGVILGDTEAEYFGRWGIPQPVVEATCFLFLIDLSHTGSSTHFETLFYAFS